MDLLKSLRVAVKKQLGIHSSSLPETTAATSLNPKAETERRGDSMTITVQYRNRLLAEVPTPAATVDLLAVSTPACLLVGSCDRMDSFPYNLPV